MPPTQPYTVQQKLMVSTTCSRMKTHATGKLVVLTNSVADPGGPEARPPPAASFASHHPPPPPRDKFLDPLLQFYFPCMLYDI